MSATVVTSGTVARVEMYLGSIGPTAPAPLTYDLAETAPGTWMGTGTAPSVPGQYHYTVGLYSGGKRTIQDNDAWNIQVAGPPTSPPAAQAELIPADIPLAPPFSYGNPVVADFSAGGRTVHGSEVVSNSRPDVPVSTVAQFYTDRLPRAGWTVTSSSGTAAGATSFSISATSAGADGVRACVVDYSAGTVQIFYGTATG